MFLYKVSISIAKSFNAKKKTYPSNSKCNYAIDVQNKLSVVVFSAITSHFKAVWKKSYVSTFL